MYYFALSDRLLVGDGVWSERVIGRELECLAADPRAPDRAFVGTADDGLQRTTDGGSSWTTALTAGDRVTSVTVSPHDPEEVWAGTEPSAVYRSTDGGETWLDHPEGARRDNHTLTTHPDAPERVYTAAGDGYALSSDRGETWTYPQTGLDHRYVWSVAVHPDDPDSVVVSAASGARSAHSTSEESYVYQTTGDEWTTAMSGLPGPDGLARPVLASDDDGFLALTNHGLFRSASGTTWDRIGAWDESYEQVPRGLAVV